MMKRRFALVFVLIPLIAAIIAYSTKSEKGDYIIEKGINGNNIATITVVHHLSEKEAKAKSLSYFLNNEDKDDVMVYHVNDIALYNDLNVGERVTVRTMGYIMQSYPPQAVADEIIRHDQDGNQ
ncbi:DUF3221 domain-containing protein [Paenibacillus sp. PL91]|uniref:DUF3221 domain-containing protein n=1 Tax=Paenibacillus sp. PL91 TaxID=2729538 RepID=UPI00145E829E|nr:DUF3221 domain-containing protein [Paenibacillus sp. PL91]MBC9201318.1 DUF3221 domain-containing protein [Paenibacillus sp. PL91]